MNYQDPYVKSYDFNLRIYQGITKTKAKQLSYFTKYLIPAKFTFAAANENCC